MTKNYIQSFECCERELIRKPKGRSLKYGISGQKLRKYVQLKGARIIVR